MATYKLHVFTSTSPVTVNNLGDNSEYNNIEYIVIGGGGGGGGSNGGGGGAGGMLWGNVTATSELVGNSTVTVGGGGNPGGSNRWGAPGSNSSIFSFVGQGGGGGAADAPAPASITGRAGGSGGGGGTGPTGGQVGGTGVTGQGNPGGSGSTSSPGGAFLGGGGGAGVAGTSTPNPATNTGPAGPGGDGLAIPWIPASYGVTNPLSPGRWFAGGGGGGGKDEPSSGKGGAGGGGNGSRSGSNPPSTGVTNTGGGGGGMQTGGGTGYTGGSGLVVIKYLKGHTGSFNPAISRVAEITNNVESLNKNESVVFTVNTVNAANAEVLYFDTTGNVSNSSFSQGNTGSFEINGNVGTVTFTAIEDLEAIKTFAIQIRRGTVTGSVLATSDTVDINVTTVASVTPLVASGGFVTTYQDDGGQYWKSHTFANTGSFAISSTSPDSAYNEVEYLIVGGGAGGGLDQGGGGGAGGLLQSTFTGTSSTYTITVGAGGAASNGSPRDGGSSSIANPGFPATITAYGGGAGGSEGASGNGGSGTYGSGGGSAGWSTKPGTVGTPGQGYGGGSSTPNSGGGGGGAGGAGTNGSSGVGGPGGLAAVSNIRAGFNVEYAGGGGAGAYQPTFSFPTGGGAGAGRGSNGGSIADDEFINRVAQIPNRGSGGGGGWGFGDPEARGGTGSSGIVVVRYKVAEEDVVSTPNVEILLVGGGGGGGIGTPNAWEAGGGGAGGMVWHPAQTVSAGTTYTVTVGSGGAANINGANTTFSTPGSTLLIALGGGHGGSGYGADGAGGEGGDGGCGGGGSHDNNAGGSSIQATSPAIPADSRTYGYGFAGGQGGGGEGGGGGGLGEAGDTDGQRQGGDGATIHITGTPFILGGGGAFNDNIPGDGGGGAKRYDKYTDADVYFPGNVNTGGGGAGSSDQNISGGAGGSGIVYISYPSEYKVGTVTGNVQYDHSSNGKHIFKFTSTGTITF